MADKITSADKRLVKDFLHDYVNDGGDAAIPFQAFERTQQWADGYTFTEIAEQEGVSPQTVGKQVRKVVMEIKNYVKEVR